MTANYPLQHYAQHGIVLGSTLHIALKQHSYLSKISSNLTFSTYTYIGYLKLLPTNRFELGKLYKLSGVKVRQSRVYYDFPYHRPLFPYHHIDLDLWHTLHVTRVSPACVTIQRGPLDHLPADVYNQRQDQVMAMFHLSSVEKTIYSKASFMLFSKEDISKFGNCQGLFVVYGGVLVPHVKKRKTSPT